MTKKHHQATKPAAEEELQEQPSPAETETACAEQAPDEYYERFVRLSADFENFRKRTEREKAAFLSYGKKELAEKLLPSYEILLRQTEKWASVREQATGELKNVLDGVQMIAGEITKAFQAEGIERMDVLDKPYDPATQEVVGMVPSSEKQDGHVLQEVQMGFTLDGKVLRPARVIVGQEQEN